MKTMSNRFLLLGFLVLSEMISPIYAESLKSVARFAGDSAYSVIDLTSGEIVFEKRGLVPMKPASVLKIVTSIAALEKLGPEHLFKTEFYVSNNELLVVAGADPSLTTEELFRASLQLKSRLPKDIDRLRVSTGSFTGGNKRSGNKAYQTGSSPLSFNFNSIEFIVCPDKISTVPDFGRAIKINDRLRRRPTGGGSAITIDAVRANEYTIVGHISGNSCVSKYASLLEPDRLFGMYLGALLDIKESPILDGALNLQNLKPIYIHESRPLSEVLYGLNHFSTNVIGEQLLYHISDSYNYDDGLLELRKLLVGVESIVDSTSSMYRIVDGSGLSHDNRVTTRAIADLLARAYKNPSYGVEFVSSLAHGGVSGTLKKRPLLFGERTTVRAKTGSIDGVSSIAGYVYGANMKGFAFAIINQTSDIQTARKFEENLIEELSGLLKS